MRAAEEIAPPYNRPVDVPVVLSFSATPFQTDWQGDGADYMLRAAFPEYGLSPATLATEWDRVALSGVKTVSTEYLESWAMPAYPSGSPNWTSAEMTGFYAALQALKDRGVQVMIKMGWHFPQNVGALTGAAPITPTPANEATFAAWVSESLNQFLNVRDYSNILGCFFFTEPSTVQIGTIPGGYTDIEYYVHILDVVQAKIVADDGGRTPIRPRIAMAGPSTQSFASDAAWIVPVAESGVADSISSHDYCNVPDFPPLNLVATECSGYQAWIDVFATRVGDAGALKLTADESGFIHGGDADTSGYRATSDAGWQWCRLIDGHMQAGCVGSFVWLLEDQPVLGGTLLQYGVLKWIATAGNEVKPSWYAFSMHANLTGGGLGTSLFRCTGGDSLIHGTGVFVPFGVKNAVDPAGEWSFVVINEGVAADVGLQLGVSLGGRTVYRYAYSGEFVYPTAVNPAYLLPWSKTYADVTTSIPLDRVPGRSVTVFSTMDIAAPASPNLALTAAATTDSPVSFGTPRNAIRGNPSNVVGTVNGWRKTDDGARYLQLAWGDAVTVGRVELAFVGTTPGVVYATYLDTSSPAPAADYTVQYWNGSAWADFSAPVNVTGNAQPNRSHSFTPVSTTALRLIITSAAATAQVNNFAAYAS